MKYVKIAIIMIVIGLLLAIFLNEGLTREEQVKCFKLIEQSKEFQTYDEKTDTGFYITKSEKEMCDSHGLEINAFVK